MKGELRVSDCYFSYYFRFFELKDIKERLLELFIDYILNWLFFFNVCIFYRFY